MIDERDGGPYLCRTARPRNEMRPVRSRARVEHGATARDAPPRRRVPLQDRPSSALPYGTSEFYASLVDRCVQGLLEAVGEGNVEAVLMVGAPTRGEATVVDTPQGPYSLSDVDLACVGKPGVDVAQLRSRLAAWVALANTEFARECTGVDASVKTRGAEAPVYPLIATFEMLRSPTVVWGSESILSELPEVALADVPAWDSLVLLHNRTVEQVLLSRRLGASGEDTGVASPAATPGGTLGLGEPIEPGEILERGEPLEHTETLRLLYASGKFLLDAVTALLFLDRNVPETYADRAYAFSHETLVRPENARLRSALREFVPDIETWARFKSSGDLSDLSGIPGATPDDPIALARHCFLRYAPCCGIVWRAILGSVVGTDALKLPTVSVVRLYPRLESLPRKIVRSLKMLRSPAGRAGLFSTGRVLKRATFASPRMLAYATAVLIYLSYSGSEDEGVLGSLLRETCPFRVPPDFAELPLERKREVLIDSFSLFHASVLRGRKIPERS